MMTIDEAIYHCQGRAKADCSECAEEHLQLAEWLEELKQYRALGTVEELQEAREEHNKGWILVEERLPEEHDTIFKKLKGTSKWRDTMFEKMSDNVNATVEYENGERRTKTLYTVDGKWKTEGFVKYKVIAWQPLPEPYKQEGCV